MERGGTVKGLDMDAIARATRMGKRTIAQHNEVLERCGFIRIVKPEGLARLQHKTAEIITLDPPRTIPGELIEEFALKDSKTSRPSYQPLSHWLVADTSVQLKPPAVSNETSGSFKQNRDTVSNETATFASLRLHPTDIAEREIGGAGQVNSNSVQTDQHEIQPPAGKQVVAGGNAVSTTLSGDATRLPFGDDDTPEVEAETRWLEDGTRTLSVAEHALVRIGLKRLERTMERPNEMFALRKLFTSGCPVGVFEQVLNDLTNADGLLTVTNLVYVVRCAETRLKEMAASAARANATPKGTPRNGKPSSTPGPAKSSLRKHAAGTAWGNR
jgi:hypothetical protein